MAKTNLQKLTEIYFPNQRIISTWFEEEKEDVHKALHYLLNKQKEHYTLVDSIEPDEEEEESRYGYEVWRIEDFYLIIRFGQPDSYWLSKEQIVPLCILADSYDYGEGTTQEDVNEYKI